MVKLQEQHLATFAALRQQFLSNTTWVEEFDAVKQKRKAIQPQILELLRRFVAAELGVEELRNEFHLRTANEWKDFGLKGMSGAMFLNMLVKHVQDQQAITCQLRAALKAPKSEPDGRDSMATFRSFLSSEIESGRATPKQIQLARVPFFQSAIWSLQDTELWPVFHPTARRVLKREGLYLPQMDLVEDYFDFRDCYMSLMSTLHLTSWELEHICWHADLPKDGSSSSTTTEQLAAEDKDDDEPETDTGTPHSQAQWVLATIGRSLGCKIWIEGNDHSKIWEGQRLGDLSLPSLPNLGMGSESQKIISMIDVLWLKGWNQVVAAFEIEHTTSVYSGLLRMSDLTVLSPNLLFPLYIVAPKSRLVKVRKELARPTFQTLELHKRCRFFSSEALIFEAAHIQKWAKDPSAIDVLAESVGDVTT